jgi:hypothetical protein
MACVLKRDPKGRFDAIAPPGKPAKVFVRSDAASKVVVVAAMLGASELEIDEGTISLPKMKEGVQALAIVVEGLRPNDDLQLVEACEGEPEELATKIVGAAPGGGANPLVGFTIRVR